MIKKIGIVSLSSGVLGESFVEHEVKIGLDRLNKLGVEIEFLPNSLKGIDFLKNHPEIRNNQFWSSKLWSSSYYVGTVGNMNKETVRQYILNQYDGMK